MGKINFTELDYTGKDYIERLINLQASKTHYIRLICSPVDTEYNKIIKSKSTFKSGYFLHFALEKTSNIHHCYNYYDNHLVDGYYSPILDGLYLRMFFPEIYEYKHKMDEINGRAQSNFYSKRKKILLGESLAYIILLALSVVAMILIDFMIIIAAAVLRAIFVACLIYEFKFRKIPHIDQLPQEEIEKIPTKIEQEKNQNKKQDQNKDEEDDKKDKNNDFMEINTDSHEGDKNSLQEKINNVNKNNEKQKNGNEQNKSGTVFSRIDENKNNDTKKKENPENLKK